MTNVRKEEYVKSALAFISIMMLSPLKVVVVMNFGRSAHNG